MTETEHAQWIRQFWKDKLDEITGIDRMNDNKQIQLLKDAIKAYENGEILEAKDMVIEFINNITDFEIESEIEE